MPTYPHAGFFPPLWFPNQFGRPTPGKAVGFYVVGTDTPTSLYADRERVVAASNPFTLDTNGNTPPFFGNPGVYDARRVVGGVPADDLVRVEIDVDKQDALVVLAAAAMDPGALIVGVIVRDGDGAAISAGVVWPDGEVGLYTADAVSASFPGAVDAYHVTYGVPAHHTFTQPTVTRDVTTGAVTTRPTIVVT